jgi:uncharacterized protein YdaL
MRLIDKVWPHSTKLRWLAAAVLSAVVVLGTTAGVRLAGAEEPATLPPPGKTWPRCAVAAPATDVGKGSKAASNTTLILADEPDDIYATLAKNLASHFGPVKVLDSSLYIAGMLDEYRAVIYVGVAPGEPLPSSFLADVHAGLGPVLWLGANADRLAQGGAFETTYGWLPGPLVRAKVKGVRYRNTMLTRSPTESEPLRTFAAINRSMVTTLAEVVGEDGRVWPWAIKSANLIYVGEVALNGPREDDRYLAVADLLYELLAPHTPIRRRALVRLEDIGPNSSPEQLKEAGKLLAEENIPFSFAVYPIYRGPVSERPRRKIRLKDRPEVVDAITYLLESGGTMVLHGYTHQSDDTVNPTNGESGEDFEFFRTHWDSKRRLVYDGPIRADSTERIEAALAELRAARLPEPKIFEVPHYAAAPADYRVISKMFDARFDRGNYFSPDWRGQSPSGPYMNEQFVPYLVRDDYGSVVVPETLGYVETTPAEKRAGSVKQIVAHARTQLVVRDNVAGFFFHPFLETAHLEAALDGIRKLGYRFVAPCDL